MLRCHSVPLSTYTRAMLRCHSVPLSTYTQAMLRCHSVPLSIYTRAMLRCHSVPLSTYTQAMLRCHSVPLSTYTQAMLRCHSVPLSTHTQAMLRCHSVHLFTHTQEMLSDENQILKPGSMGPNYAKTMSEGKLLHSASSLKRLHHFHSPDWRNLCSLFFVFFVQFHWTKWAKQAWCMARQVFDKEFPLVDSDCGPGVRPLWPNSGTSMSKTGENVSCVLQVISSFQWCSH